MSWVWLPLHHCRRNHCMPDVWQKTGLQIQLLHGERLSVQGKMKEIVSQNSSIWKGPTRVTESNSWFYAGPTHSPSPVSKSGVPALPELQHWDCAHCPLGQSLSLTPPALHWCSLTSFPQKPFGQLVHTVILKPCLSARMFWAIILLFQPPCPKSS